MEAIFDGYAAGYDQEFTHTPIGECQREQVRQHLAPLLAAGSLRILELNCGTGEDAAWLAQQGHEVVATDISTQMLVRTRQKLMLANLESRAQALELGIEDISAALFDRPFDLIFSNFGGWNCLSMDQIRAVAPKLSACLAPQGKLVAVIMPDRCLWETGYFMARGRAQDARRRWGGQAPFADSQGRTHPIYYFSPRQFAKLWGAEWHLEKTRPVGLWVPPSYLNPHFESRPGVLTWLQQRDRHATRGSRYADHAYVQLERKEA